MTVQNLEKELMGLDARSRAKLASKLISSLEKLSDVEIEKLWIEEVSRREKELNKGKAKLKSADIVFKNAHARIK